jgi:hypothetical protein
MLKDPSQPISQVLAQIFEANLSDLDFLAPEGSQRNVWKRLTSAHIGKI